MIGCFVRLHVFNIDAECFGAKQVAFVSHGLVSGSVLFKIKLKGITQQVHTKRCRYTVLDSGRLN